MTSVKNVWSFKDYKYCVFYHKNERKYFGRVIRKILKSFENYKIYKRNSTSKKMIKVKNNENKINKKG